MKFWQRKIDSWDMKFILSSVNDDLWQAFRCSMKGVSTEDKLDMLEDYIHTHEVNNTYNNVEKCRIDNYVNALLRGGQLKHQEGCIVVQR